MINLNPFWNLILGVLGLYKYLLIIWIAMSWLIALDIINHRQPLVNRALYIMSRLVEPVLSYIRRYIPNLGGLDISALILFFLIGFLKDVIIYYFYR